ncbi:ribonuclease D [Pokkaliibacter sp. CJK22405]|uniref:ribonuclease D n=1 Tax=Pokkaliibacter sp. CJK22405 TaxID=3384615 RepID=UPI003984F0D9
MSPVNASDFQWIADDATLDRFASEWLTVPALMVDTEFERTQTFYPRPGLIQVYDGKQVCLIDPLKIRDFSSFGAVLTSPDVLKVMHSGSEDIELFIHRLGYVPVAVFDSQIAAAYAGVGQGMGFQRLVEAVTGKVLEKGETRSDWLQRPLTDSQCLYACDDVLWLYPVYESLRQKLDSAGRLEWLLEDTRDLVNQIASGTAPEEYYTRMKMAWQLSQEELVVLQEVCRWREEFARKQDLSRNQVMPDRALFDIARRHLERIDQLYQIENIRPAVIKRNGREVLAVAEAAREFPKEVWPAEIPRPLSKNAQKRLNRLKDVVGRVADEQGIPADMLARKRDLEVFVREASLLALPEQWPVGLQGWRTELLKPELTTLILESEK